jgi:hypothetical protein
LKHSSEKPSRLFFSMAFLMAILQLAGCEKPRPKQLTVATEPSFVELANQISQEELDQLVASVVGLRRLRQQLERHCTSNPRSTRCRQLLDEGLGQMDASTVNSSERLPTLDCKPLSHLSRSANSYLSRKRPRVTTGRSWF